MPRKAPDKVTEHRITFGNFGKGFSWIQQKEQAKINSIIKGVGSIAPSLGIIAVGGGFVWPLMLSIVGWHVGQSC